MSSKKNVSNKIIDINDVYLRLASDTKSSVKTALAANAEINELVQTKLLENGGNSVYQALASNPSITRKNLDSLIVIKNTDSTATDWIIQGLCENPALPEDIVTSMMDTLEDSAYFMLIKCPSLNNMQKQQLLTKVIHPSQYPSNLEIAASNDALSPEQINFLLKHESENVRGALARNSILEKTTQITLAKDSSTFVRKILALNRNLNKQAETILQKDPENDVQINLNRRLTLISSSSNAKSQKSKPNYEQILQESNQDNLIQVGLDTNTPLHILEKIVAMVLPNCDSWVAVAVAQNPVLEADFLTTLSKSKNPEVLKALASNANCPLALLDQLSKNKDPSVRSVIANKKRYERPSFMCS